MWFKIWLHVHVNSQYGVPSMKWFTSISLLIYLTFPSFNPCYLLCMGRNRFSKLSSSRSQLISLLNTQYQLLQLWICSENEFLALLSVVTWNIICCMKWMANLASWSRFCFFMLIIYTMLLLLLHLASRTSQWALWVLLRPGTTLVNLVLLLPFQERRSKSVR